MEHEEHNEMLGFQDVWDGMNPPERVAMVTSGVGFLIAMLAMPSLLCWFGQRPGPEGLGDLIFELIVFELLGSVTLVFVPIKAWLKTKIHGDATRPPAPRHIRIALQATWILTMSVMFCALAPQGFFLITGRGVATTSLHWLRDAGAMLLAIAPSVIALGPWIWASRRFHKRCMEDVHPTS